MRNLLLRTIHGSHLYGFAHADSDYDYFEVYDSPTGRWAKQTIEGNTDVLRTNLHTFMQYASTGTPQFVEAMYSRKAEVDLLPFRFSFYPHYGEAIRTYHRTIKALYMKGAEENNDKLKRHAWRLAFNLKMIEERKIFDPTTTESQRAFIMQHINEYPGEK